MIDRLASVLSIIDHNSETVLIEPFLLSSLGNDDHQVAQKSSMRVIGFAQLRETLPIFWDHQEMSFGNCIDISKSQAQIVFKDYISWDLFRHDLVKDCHLFCRSCLS